MGLHIEMSGECSEREWLGVKALAMIALGEISLEALATGLIVPTREAPAPTPAATSPLEPDSAPEPVAEAPTPAPPPPVAHAPLPPSESMMAGAVAAQRAAVAAGAELDAAGLPWDARIHAGTRTRTAKDMWTQKRGADPALIAAVTAELKTIMAAPVATPPAPPPPVATDTAQDPAAVFGGASPEPAAVPAPPVAEAPVPPAPTAGPEANPGATVNPIAEFARVMRLVTAKQASNTLSPEGTDEIVKSLGLTSVRDLIKRPDLLDAFEAMLP